MHTVEGEVLYVLHLDFHLCLTKKIMFQSMHYDQQVITLNNVF